MVRKLWEMRLICRDCARYSRLKQVSGGVDRERGALGPTEHEPDDSARGANEGGAGVCRNDQVAAGSSYGEAAMMVAVFSRWTLRGVPWNLGRGVCATLKRMGIQPLPIDLPMAQQADANMLAEVKKRVPPIETLKTCDAVLTCAPEHIGPWIEAVYERYEWRNLNVPTAMWLNESCERDDYIIDLEAISWIGREWFFPAVQDAEKHDQPMFAPGRSHWLPYGVDTEMFCTDGSDSLCKIIRLHSSVAFRRRRWRSSTLLRKHAVPPIRLASVAISDIDGYDIEGSTRRYATNLRRVKVFFNLPSERPASYSPGIRSDGVRMFGDDAAVAVGAGREQEHGSVRTKYPPDLLSSVQPSARGAISPGVVGRRQADGPDEDSGQRRARDPREALARDAATDHHGEARIECEGELSRFVISIVRPGTYPHSDCFKEVAETLQYGLEAIGEEATIRENYFARDSWNIILGAHLLPTGYGLPPKAILYNLEQHESGAFRHCLTFKPAHDTVWWDYSHRNVNRLPQNWPRARVVPIGYMPQLSRIQPREQDIDVLFYGSFNDRRREMIERLKGAGVKVEPAFCTYGLERDELIARAKIVLNVHFYKSNIFEVVRCSYLMANKKAIVSEHSEEIDADLKSGIHECHYDNIPYYCKFLLANNNDRKALAERGYEAMCRRDEREILKAAWRARWQT